jgi:lipid II:glycine glycyltransferase (peptidoglycan interpeptide bridge formation enzyme)
MVEVKPVTNATEWEAFLASQPEANFLQSWLWGDFQEKINRHIYRSGFYNNNNLIGVMLSVVEPARRARYLTVPGGPIIDWTNKGLARATVDEMRRIGKQEKCVFVRARPQLLDNPESRSLFIKLGFKEAPMHLHAELTSQLDITPDEGQLANHFRKNTRYELKQAKKRGIVVSQTTDPAAIDGFYDLQLQTAQRHGFVPYGKKFLKEQFAVFAAAGKAVLYSAHTADGQLIAQAFIIFYNHEAAYHYGASTELGRREPGAYLIQWEAIKEAKKRGCSRYNFWGVVKPEQTNHRFYGVSVFKRGFRGEDVEYLHAQDLVLNQVRYLPNLLIEKARKRRRHL